jgi:hypothetical protein
MGAMIHANACVVGCDHAITVRIAQIVEPRGRIASFKDDVDVADIDFAVVIYVTERQVTAGIANAVTD